MIKKQFVEFPVGAVLEEATVLWSSRTGYRTVSDSSTSFLATTEVSIMGFQPWATPQCAATGSLVTQGVR